MRSSSTTVGDVIPAACTAATLSCEYGEVNSPAVAEQEAQQNLGRRKWEETVVSARASGYNRNE